MNPITVWTVRVLDLAGADRREVDRVRVRAPSRGDAVDAAHDALPRYQSPRYRFVAEVLA